jgi:hypothetical protein
MAENIVKLAKAQVNQISDPWLQGSITQVTGWVDKWRYQKIIRNLLIFVDFFINVTQLLDL